MTYDIRNSHFILIKRHNIMRIEKPIKKKNKCTIGIYILLTGNN